MYKYQRSCAVPLLSGQITWWFQFGYITWHLDEDDKGLPLELRYYTVDLSNIPSIMLFLKSVNFYTLFLLFKVLTIDFNWIRLPQMASPTRPLDYTVEPYLSGGGFVCLVVHCYPLVAQSQPPWVVLLILQIDQSSVNDQQMSTSH